jgi:putative ABC transport system ATP-binding protein
MILIISEPGEETREFNLKPGTYSLGRSDENDLLIKDQNVSRNHARIIFNPDGTLVIEDLKSTNGVLVNETRIKDKGNVNEGDVIKLGETTIGVKSPTETEDETIIGDSTETGTVVMQAPHMISLENVVKVYLLGKVEVKALKGVDLAVEEGEFISVCGPSGSGKSTLLNLIGCIDSPTSGKLSFMGNDVTGFSDAELSSLRNSSIGFIFQNFNLIPVLTAFENVEYPLVIQGMPKGQRVEKSATILKEVGLEEFVKHKPDELSGGQRQRVAIARALVTNPKMVLADEPTANLDSKTGIEILDLMQKMNEEHKTTFIFSTHDPKIEKYAKKIYSMVDGRLVI